MTGHPPHGCMTWVTHGCMTHRSLMCTTTGHPWHTGHPCGWHAGQACGQHTGHPCVWHTGHPCVYTMQRDDIHTSPCHSSADYGNAKKMAQHVPGSCEAWRVRWRDENNATENGKQIFTCLHIKYSFISTTMITALTVSAPAGEKLVDVRHATTHNTKKTTKTTTVVYYWVMKPTQWRDDRFRRTFNFHRSTAPVVVSQHATSAAARLYTSKIENWSGMARQGSEDCCVTWIMSQV